MTPVPISTRLGLAALALLAEALHLGWEALHGGIVSHHLLQRPRDVPVRTSLGAMAITAYVVLWISGGNDLIADKFDLSLNAMIWFGRIGFLLLPPIAYWATYRLCIGFERHDREVLEHGI